MACISINEFINILNERAPFKLAEQWDRSGFRLGESDALVTAAAVALDPSPEAVAKAAALGCNLLITHHPLLFHAAGDLICDRPDVKAAKTAFTCGINIVSCHTNFDSCINGVNHLLAKSAKLNSIKPLVCSDDSSGFGMGAIGSLFEKMSAIECCDGLAQAWRLSGYRLLGNTEKVSRVALCGGAGGEFWKRACEEGAQIYATADMRYHECLEALDAGLSLMICDHGEMEDTPLQILSDDLRSLSEIPVYYLPRDAFSHSVSLWRLTGRDV